MDEITRKQYADEITSLVDSMIEEARADGDDEDAFNDRVWQTIDGHQWVIYTHYNFAILYHSSNSDYAVTEWGPDGIVDADGIAWAKLAFGALYADVMDEIASREDFDPSDPCAIASDPLDVGPFLAAFDTSIPE